MESKIELAIQQLKEKTEDILKQRGVTIQLQENGDSTILIHDHQKGKLLKKIQNGMLNPAESDLIKIGIKLGQQVYFQISQAENACKQGNIEEGLEKLYIAKDLFRDLESRNTHANRRVEGADKTNKKMKNRKRKRDAAIRKFMSKKLEELNGNYKAVVIDTSEEFSVSESKIKHDFPHISFK